MPEKAGVTQLGDLSRAVRHRILTMTTAAGSGHPTSSLSATDLLVGLLFGGTLRADLENHDLPTNDRLIFSKGHASPLFYALYATAGVLSDDELTTYRQLGSTLEGHPRPNFPWAEAATGSLGQGLAIGAGMAMAAKLDDLPYRSFVLLGDSEMAEGSNWEAIQLAAVQKLGNIVAILDVNRLGQRGETMYGAHPAAFAERIGAFGWRTFIVDGHDQAAIQEALGEATEPSEQPAIIIAGTIKGKGVSFLEDKDGWHGKALPEDTLTEALAELGDVDLGLRGTVAPPDRREVPAPAAFSIPERQPYALGDEVATRTAFGTALARLGADPNVVVLDAEVGNSTMTETFGKAHPERYLECFIAEQYQAGLALGLARRGKRPVAATFAAFLTRSHDQIRMNRYSLGHVTFVGSHCGVSIGADGPSQMGLEDLALFRSIPDAVVLYPSDAVSAERLTELAVAYDGVSYLRTTRGPTPVIYQNEAFSIGGSHVLRHSDHDVVTIVAAGITLPEALAAADTFAGQGTPVRVIDAYSISPIDQQTLRAAAQETGRLVTVEDHYAAGGLGDAVRAALTEHPVPVHSLAVTEVMGSASPEEQLKRAGIDRQAILTYLTENL